MLPQQPVSSKKNLKTNRHDKKIFICNCMQALRKKNQTNYFECNSVHCKNTFSSIESPFGKNNSHFVIFSSFVSTRYRKGQSCILINLFLWKSTSTRQVHTCNLSGSHTSQQFPFPPFKCSHF